jgi:hypothetical protein
MMFSRKLPGFFGAVGLVLGLIAASPVSASADSAFNCRGGPIPPGNYSSLDISGFCLLAAGNVTVTHDVTVLSGGALLAVFAGSNLTVGGNVMVKSGGAMALGCEPFAFTCFNDQPPGTQATADSIGGNLIAENALLVLAHHNKIGGNVEEHGGGGGLNCDPLPFGPPAYSTYEDNMIGGNASVSGLRTCWVGFFRNQVAGNVNWHNNQTLDPDGNEIASNTIQGNLNCSNNTPAPQLGDSITVGNGPNTVFGRNTGQCPPVLLSD